MDASTEDGDRKDAAIGDGGSSDAAPSKDDPPPTEGTLVGPDGGTVEGPGGARVDIPAGALGEPTVVGLREVSSGYPDPPSNIKLGRVFAALPHDQTFEQPVRLRIPFEGRATSRLTMYTDASGSWAPVTQDVTVGADALEIETTHFSHYTHNWTCEPPYEDDLECGCYHPQAYFGSCGPTIHQPDECCPDTARSSDGTVANDAPMPQCAFSSSTFWGCCSAFRELSSWRCPAGYVTLSISGTSSWTICARPQAGVSPGELPPSDACAPPICPQPPCE